MSEYRLRRNSFVKAVIIFTEIFLRKPIINGIPEDF